MTWIRGLGILLAILVTAVTSVPGPAAASTVPDTAAPSTVSDTAADARPATSYGLTVAAAGETGPRRPETARPAADGRRITIPKTSAPKSSGRPDPVETGTVPVRPAGAKPAAATPATATPVATTPATTTPVAATPAAPAAAVAAPAPGEPLVVRGVRFVLEGETTRVVFDLSRGVEIDSFGLLDPFRVVVDLPEVRFDLPADTGRDAKGVVTAWRYGLFMAGRSRLVFDLAGPVAIERAAVEPASGSFGARLVIELKRSTREAFSAHVRRAREQPVREGVGLLSKGDREAPRPQRAKAMVVIDPGHGGIDVGTRSPATGTFEKTVVLDIARLLAAKLAATGRYEVKMTRTDDSFIPLAERVAVARANHADLFLSVHADAEYDRLVRGATVYTLDDRASDGQAAALAAKENASDALAGVIPEETFDEVADILIDLTVRETKRFSHVLARHLVDGLKTVGRLVKSNPHRSANFRVLKAHDIPSALVELGFMSNKDDEQLLMSADWREKTTTALVAAVDRFFDSRMAAGPN